MFESGDTDLNGKDTVSRGCWESVYICCFGLVDISSPTCLKLVFELHHW